MTVTEVDSARLRSEIAAFYAGFGVASELTAAFDASTLLVPLSGPEDRMPGVLEVIVEIAPWAHSHGSGAQ
ncbi:hypothetical protein AB0I35_22690 [Nocardia sp. NPDC050378]|uniref:hypothetical protein n=1 Tax=Nocardia sp. NPDC050378 TaxID=3155400 RepID=UPI003410EC8A